jgi:hypothetical protein
VLIAFLTLVSGIAWTVVYAEAIRVGFRDRTYAMPIAALCLNFAWESTYAVHDLVTAPSLQAYVNLVWAIADLGIVYTYLRFGRSELPGFISRSQFIVWSLLLVPTISGPRVVIQVLDEDDPLRDFDQING